ncbi:alpha-D-ribose 1-methylphosphonate 5-triphosphate diphosphatase [Sulfitobacter sp. D35]|uniref:alpha-D-ribose 1-methylphosphonate 5-triphosphate diphosphatase n=1 Tax=Sulfitobacter sp. D35 TaxID=3083252 RepID=UPI00296F5B09|nr:alpha-D-ribose 1-methylphosphonate 5-triphosphate diphosphatase [Sulfitobacter sp. D35]MDW4497100.1 alpha-D-ribose 1-methylphosphonate 5-triphosphate diphosphatase [Sulfitobacter sp. D35]
MIDLDLTGAEVLRPDGLQDTRLSFAEGRIVADRVGRKADLRGFLVLPGMIDLHGDAFERHVAPRRGAMKQMHDGILATEAEIAANGISTAVLAQFVSWEGGLRGPDFAGEVFAAIRAAAPEAVTDLRAQLRFETHMLEHYDALPRWVRDWAIDYVVFNDHLPHDRLAQGKRPPRLTGQALKAGRNPEAHFEMLLALHRNAGAVPEALDRACAALAHLGVRMGSHDDRSAADREDWHGRGVRIAEFPETPEAAEAARGQSDAVVLGAPNVVRGGSHKGNVSAVELVSLGLCDALASDYHYPSLRRAAFFLADSGVADLASAWALVSSGPARVLGLTDRGTLAPGARADLVIVEAESRRVAGTLSGGRFSYLSGALAERLIG